MFLISLLVNTSLLFAQEVSSADYPELSLAERTQIFSKSNLSRKPAPTDTPKARRITKLPDNIWNLPLDLTKQKAAPPEWLSKMKGQVNSVISTALQNFAPNRYGSDTFNVAEGIPIEFIKKIADTNLNLVFEGKGTTRILGGPFYYSDYQGGMSVQYNFLEEGTASDANRTLFGIRFSPTYGEFTFVKISPVYMNKIDIPGFNAAIGAAFGIELSKRVSWFEAGARISIQPLATVLGEKATGTTIDSIVFMKFKLAQLYHASSYSKKGHKSENANLFLEPYMAYYSRGNQFEGHYNWDGWQNFPARSILDTNSVTEGGVRFEIVF